MKTTILNIPVRLILAISALIIFCCDNPGYEREIRLDQLQALDKLIERQQKSHHIPGFAVAVISNGKVIKEITSGFADVSSGAIVSPTTSFQIASTTKSFTATAIMLLIKEGTVKLTDKVGDLLTDLPTSWNGVTVRQLMSHTSGLPDISSQSGGIELIADSWDSAIKKIYDAPLLFSPGENWSYGVTNYVLLSMIIEKKSGKSLEEFMTERLFQPLDMKNTFFTNSNDRNKLIAINYERYDGKNQAIRNLTFPKFVHAAGGLFSSLEDLILWNTALDTGWVLPPELLKEMWTSSPLNDGSKFRINGKTLGYGLGWVVDDAPQQWAVGHSGGNSTGYRKFIDEKFTIIVLHNGVLDPDGLIESIATIMRSKPGEAEPTPQVRLWEAAISGDTTEIINSLNEKADIELLDTRQSKSGRRALNWAAWFNHPEAVQVLLKNGANINAANATGFTALHHAAESGSLSAAKVLLENGADPGLINKNGNNPSEIAISQNHPEIADLIESFKVKSD